MNRSTSTKLLALLASTVFLFSFTTLTYKTDFSGSWSLNEGKSELGDFGDRFAARKIKAEQKDDAITIAKTATNFNGEEVTNTETLTFDGKTSETTGFANSKKKSTVKWSDDGQSMAISYTIAFDRGGQTMEIKGTETWTLSADGKTLSVQVSSSSAQGDFSMKAMYDKG